MENTFTNSLLEIAKNYEDIIRKFKQRSDVYNGEVLAWKGSDDIALFVNTPKGIGDGLGTTGWCVSASQALLFDGIFQTNLRFRNAKAKLISIDIKEQYWGYCYNGSQNKWHTAILVEDSGIKIVIDITCRQFGDKFIDKDIWDFDSWQTALRSPLCKHKITDFEDNQFLVAPIATRRDIYKNELPIVDSIHQMMNYTNLSGDDRVVLTKFLIEDFEILNTKLIVGNLNKTDWAYLEEVTDLLKVLPFKQIPEGFAVLTFESKNSMKNWLRIFLEDGNRLPNYLMVSKTLSQACKFANIDVLDLNTEYKMGNEEAKTYLVFQFNSIYGVESPLDGTELILAHGLILDVDKNMIFNSGTLVEPNKNHNTIYVKVGSTNK